MRLGDLFDFPYREVWPTLEAMVRNIGADHLLWGTDMPFQNRFCTYRQSRKWIEEYCEFLGESELRYGYGRNGGENPGVRVSSSWFLVSSWESSSF